MTPEYKPLQIILGDKIFKIPEYQRHYSWQDTQRNDFFGDLRNLVSAKNAQKNTKKNHFMATIVCLKTKELVSIGSKDFNFYDIVDGQQRLTTLVILLKAISLKLKKDGKKDEANDLNRLLFKDAGSIPILQSNHDEKSILSNYLKKGTHPTNTLKKNASDNNLEQAIENCEEFVNSFKVNDKSEEAVKPDDTIKLLSLVMNDLWFIFLSIEDEGAVYTVFEVLNSRGLDVDWLDKCKSLLMGLLYEKTNTVLDDNTFNNHLKVLHNHWANIYRIIGLRKILGYEVVRFAATLMDINKGAGKVVMSPKKSLDFFKKDCTSIEKIISNTQHIEEVVSCLSQLYDNEIQRAVTDVSQARLLAVSIMLKYNNKKNVKDRDKLLEQLERTSFKIYGLLRIDSRRQVGDYVGVAKEIQKNTNLGTDDLVKKIAEIGTNFDINGIDEEFKKDLYTNWKKELRYFFFKYEEYLSKPNIRKKQLPNFQVWNEIWQSSLNDTIEHILPQDKNSSGWNHFSVDEHDKLLHSIGNLCMLSKGKNSEAYNKPFDGEKNKNKKEIYNTVKINSLNDILYKNFNGGDNEERVVWDKEAIEERTEQLIKFAKEQWKDLDV